MEALRGQEYIRFIFSQFPVITSVHTLSSSQFVELIVSQRHCFFHLEWIWIVFSRSCGIPDDSEVETLYFRVFSSPVLRPLNCCLVNSAYSYIANYRPACIVQHLQSLNVFHVKTDVFSLHFWYFRVKQCRVNRALVVSEVQKILVLCCVLFIEHLPATIGGCILQFSTTQM